MAAAAILHLASLLKTLKGDKMSTSRDYLYAEDLGAKVKIGGTVRGQRLEGLGLGWAREMKFIWKSVNIQVVPVCKMSKS